MLCLDIPSTSQALAAAIASFVVTAFSGAGLTAITHSKGSMKGTVQTRWFSALIIGALAFGSIYFGGIAFALFIALASWMAADELLRILAVSRPRIFTILTHVANLSIVGSAWLQSSLPNNYHNNLLPFHANLTDVATIASIVLFLLVPVFAGQFRNMPTQEARSVLAVICTGWFLAHLILLRNLPHGFAATIFLVLGVVSNDTLAYITGNLFGRTQLSALLSPKKTVEGLAGGTLGTFLVMLCAPWLLPDLTLPAITGLGAAIAIFAPCGDLAISAMKRDVGVKDSSALIPGHGGILDRAGSFLLIAPVYFYLFTAL